MNDSCQRTLSEQSRPQQNVGELERWASLVAGGLCVVQGVARGRLPGLLLTGLGASLFYRGYTGHCPLYGYWGVSSQSSSGVWGVPAKQGCKIERTLTIHRPAVELYSYWRQLSNLPQIMQHLESVTEIGNLRSHWVARGPLGVQVEWDAEIYNEVPGRMIAWRSLPGGQVDTAGTVHFAALPNGVTEVRVSLKYNPPGGRLGANIAWLMGDSVEQQIASDLRRFKQVLESGAAISDAT